MPYIKKESRALFDSKIDELVSSIVNNSSDTELAGNLNYCLTRIIVSSVQNKCGKIKYWMVAMVDGVLSNMGREIYRRIAAPYEKEKIIENGDLKEFSGDKQ